MKKNYFLVLVALSVLVAACCDEVFNEPNSNALRGLLKGKPWVVSKVFIRLDNQIVSDITNTYKDMTLQFDTQTYITTNGPADKERSFWLEKGNWKFKINTDPSSLGKFTKISTPDGDVDVNITTLTDTELELNFALKDDGIRAGRTDGGLNKIVVFNFKANPNP